MFFFFCKQKTAYEMRISDWSSDVCSSDLAGQGRGDGYPAAQTGCMQFAHFSPHCGMNDRASAVDYSSWSRSRRSAASACAPASASSCNKRADTSLTSSAPCLPNHSIRRRRSEEHTSELQSLMRISYAVFCLKKKKLTP